MPGKAGSGSIGILYRPFILLSHTRYKRHRIVYERSEWSQQGLAAVVAYLRVSGPYGPLTSDTVQFFQRRHSDASSNAGLVQSFVNHQAS